MHIVYKSASSAVMCVPFSDDVHAPVVQAAAASGRVGKRSGGPTVPWRARQYDERRALRGGESVPIQLQQHLEGAKDKVWRGCCFQIGIYTIISIIIIICGCCSACSKHVCTIHELNCNACFFVIEMSCMAVDTIAVSSDPS